jgi:hypothetical protein
LDEQGKYGYSIAFLSWETFSKKIMNLCKHKKLGDVKLTGTWYLTYKYFSLVSLMVELVALLKELEVVFPETFLHLGGVQPGQPVVEVSQPDHALVVCISCTIVFQQFEVFMLCVYIPFIYI